MDRGAWWATVHGVTKRLDWATNTFRGWWRQFYKHQEIHWHSTLFRAICRREGSLQHISFCVGSSNRLALACHPSPLPRHWPSLRTQILCSEILLIVPQILSPGSFGPTPWLPPTPPLASPSPVLVALLELDHLLSGSIPSPLPTTPSQWMTTQHEVGLLLVTSKTLTLRNF